MNWFLEWSEPITKKTDLATLCCCFSQYNFNRADTEYLNCGLHLKELSGEFSARQAQREVVKNKNPIFSTGLELHLH